MLKTSGMRVYVPGREREGAKLVAYVALFVLGLAAMAAPHLATLAH
jgi:hypothetical protein